MKQPAVYILTNYHHTTLYTGVTSNLLHRIHQHRTKAVDGFAKKYNLEKWVYFELFEDIYSAINREKQLKKWRLQWKRDLIEKLNPEWRDLWYTHATP